MVENKLIIWIIDGNLSEFSYIHYLTRKSNKNDEKLSLDIRELTECVRLNCHYYELTPKTVCVFVSHV
jgi:hypothetical protein